MIFDDVFLKNVNDTVLGSELVKSMGKTFSDPKIRS